MENQVEKQVQEKIALSAEKFEVKVEIEAAYLMRENNMSKAKADKVARDIISERYVVAK